MSEAKELTTEDLKEYAEETGYGIACYRGGDWPEDWSRSSLLSLIERIAALTTERDEALRVVNEQANDEGLWFVATKAPEAYLQKELRRLHAAIEGKTQEDCARAALSAPAAEEKKV